MIETPHTGLTIANVIHEELIAWGISKKIFSITLDNATDNDVAGKSLKALLDVPVGLVLYDVFHLALDSGCKKVVVIDIDVHYGNRTAEGFYRSDKVLIVSLHMNHSSWGPSHPQSGSFDELGDGDGFGYNLNVPLPIGTRDRGYEFALI
ncbi:hypothetical protein RHGRI_034294 [Rhododendron griersonianum]|uniref:Histone deacetylase domain-containing protein n=1 Tax=Rhododendron griersonianum TaxID=479676 RepID=A0AAV6I5M6_9ERIC|nr:hypothetical protein RHGRI_034294 [Rhododendron griersonianum]